MKNSRGRRICDFHKPDNLEYRETHEDAQERMLAGESQVQCRFCKYWFWPHEYGVEPAILRGKLCGLPSSPSQSQSSQ